MFAQGAAPTATPASLTSPALPRIRAIVRSGFEIR